ncbi:uncharacterized protein LOC122506776 [Leptopilina heterotoma]|uniref:uncharacterized protein LOC122506776 n=1 Tax=Leptopilina heterotoma TaxID=63436 RepID=UPI001CA88964|nr:uncharacterized protein LOC122506776 [Leptopilina heterotoma]
MPGNIDSLKTKRKTFKSKLTRTSNWLKSEESKDVLSETLDLKLTDFVAKFSDWEADQAQLLALDTEHEEDHEKEADTITNTYFNIAGELKRLLNQRILSSSQLTSTNRHINSSNVNNHDGGASAKLPEVALPTFDGSFENFRRFHDEYQAVIHQNKKLHNVTKFHYLKSCLNGEPADLISELETNGENYEIAWKLLQDTYNNPRLILRRHCSLLMSLYKKKDQRCHWAEEFHPHSCAILH